MKLVSHLAFLLFILCSATLLQAQNGWNYFSEPEVSIDSTKNSVGGFDLNTQAIIEFYKPTPNAKLEFLSEAQPITSFPAKDNPKVFFYVFKGNAFIKASIMQQGYESKEVLFLLANGKKDKSYFLKTGIKLIIKSFDDGPVESGFTQLEIISSTPGIVFKRVGLGDDNVYETPKIFTDLEIRRFRFQFYDPLSNYVPLDTSIRLRKIDTNKFNVNLVPDFGYVTFMGDKNTSINVEGREQKQVPSLAKTRLKRGEYVLHFSKANFFPQTRRISVSEKTDTVITIPNLQSHEGLITVSTNPDNSSVYLNNERMSNLNSIKKPVGSYTLRVQRYQYLSYEEEFNLALNQHVKKTVSLVFIGDLEKNVRFNKKAVIYTGTTLGLGILSTYLLYNQRSNAYSKYSSATSSQTAADYRSKTELFHNLTLTGLGITTLATGTAAYFSYKFFLNSKQLAKYRNGSRR